MSEQKRILSCIQPTGDIHLGNYLGAIKNWVDLQADYNCFYGIVDYHAITMPYKADKLRAHTWMMAFQLLACGIKVENLFIQSLIPEHAELCWLLGCFTAYGDLTRMTQFKDKTDQLKSSNKSSLVSGGLFYYPVLQAADILMYHPHFVPVGKDQDQHLELTRSIAERFNYQFGTDYFYTPQTLFTKNAKVLSLADPNKKMSKSLGEKHYINIFGDPDRVIKQVRSAVTDSGNTNSGTMSPGVKNLFDIIEGLGRKSDHQRLLEDYQNSQLKYSELKDVVSDILVSFVNKKRLALKTIQADKKDIKYQILRSAARHRQRAQKTLKEVKSIMGLQNPKF